MANTSVTGKYLIIRTKMQPTGAGTGGSYLLGVDGIMTIIGGNYLSVIYPGGLIVKLSFQNLNGTSTNLKSGNETIVTYLTNSIIRLLNSTNTTFEIPYKFPNAVDSSGHQMFVSTITICQDTTAC